MRYIHKSIESPDSIRAWREVQEHLKVNLDYPSFTRKPQLRAELIAEQFGLCAYTGAPIDERLGGLNDENLAFQAHIEHVKPRSICQKELVERGGAYGCDLCEDMDHRNLVAALEVKRKPPAKGEVFGATARENESLPVTPLQSNCELRFQFNAIGGIAGVDAEATQTIELLKLNHATLVGWRRGAIVAFFPPGEVLTREEVERRISVLIAPAQGVLAEFSFCLAGYARSLL